MKKADIEKRTEELVMPIIERFGYELWDVEYVKIKKVASPLMTVRQSAEPSIRFWMKRILSAMHISWK